MGRRRLIDRVRSGALAPHPGPLPKGEREKRLWLQGVPDAFIFQEHHHQANPQRAVGEVKQAEQPVAAHRVGMLAHLDTDGKNQHLQHPHRRGNRAFTHLAGKQRQAHQPGVGHANPEGIEAEPRRHPQVGVG